MTEITMYQLMEERAVAVAVERERCARIADHAARIHSNPDLKDVAASIAQEIRATR